MSNTDVFEMDSLCDTEEMEGDMELGMIDEDMGKKSAMFDFYKVLFWCACGVKCIYSITVL